MPRRTRIVVVAVLLALVAAIGGWYVARTPDPSPRVTHAGSAHANRPPSRAVPTPGTLPIARHDAGASSASRTAPKPLVALFDTDTLCEQHSEAHCVALRAATARCDTGDADGCRAALALVDTGSLRDISLAVVFARRACEIGGSCERSRQLELYRRAASDPAARRAAAQACTAGDAVGCAFVAHTTDDDAEALRHAELACRGGVIALGGCIDVSIARPTARWPLEHACTSGSADGCHLLGRKAFEQGDVDAARVALARGCELSPGSDSCNGLERLERTGTLDE